MHQHTNAEQGSTIFDRKVREVAKRLDIPAAQVRDVFAAYDAITMEWAHAPSVSGEPVGGRALLNDGAGQGRRAERGLGP